MPHALVPAGGGVRLAALLALSSACGSSEGVTAQDSPGQRATGNRSAGQRAAGENGAFATVAAVLRHPRCMNCHPSGDRPHVGDDRRLHPQNVQRGPDGHGAPAMHCTACHRDANQDYSGVPGAPHWHLAPRSMGWVGLDDHQLAEALKDREKNGDRSLADLRQHMAEDPLVLWGWSPGSGRSPVSVPHDRFIAAFDAWVAAGAPSPAPGTDTRADRF